LLKTFLTTESFTCQLPDVDLRVGSRTAGCGPDSRMRTRLPPQPFRPFGLLGPDLAESRTFRIQSPRQRPPPTLWRRWIGTLSPHRTQSVKPLTTFSRTVFVCRGRPLKWCLLIGQMVDVVEPGRSDNAVQERLRLSETRGEDMHQRRAASHRSRGVLESGRRNGNVYWRGSQNLGKRGRTTRSLWPILLGISIVGLLIEPAAAQPANAAGDNDAFCILDFRQFFSPGITPARETGSQNSGGEVGSISCTGKLQGRTITGPGTIGNEGVRDADCVFDHSAGRYFVTLPTKDGPLHVEGTYSLERVGLTFNIETDQPGAHGSGWGVVIPSKGDCLLTPLTEARVLMNLWFRDADQLRSCAVDLGAVLVNCRTQRPAA
jgi:hypothetical protein